MIQELKIKNCLSFKDEAVFSFEATKDTTLEDSLIVEVVPGVRLLRFAMVMGANGSGKSNLLACFDFLRIFWNRRPRDLDDGTTACPFRLDFVTKDQPSEVEIKFWINETKYWYQVKLDENTTYEEKLYFYKSAQPTLVFKRELVDNLSVITFNPILKINNAILDELQAKCLNNMSVIAARGGVNGVFPYLDDVREWSKRSMKDIITPDTPLFDFTKKCIHEDKEIHDHIVKYLQSSKFNISDLITSETTENTDMVRKTIQAVLTTLNVPDEMAAGFNDDANLKRFKLQFVHHVENSRGEEFYTLSSNLQSYGTKRSMGIETAIYRAVMAEAFLPIDEFDTSMHPELMEYTIRCFLQMNSRSQLLITTHYDPFLSKVDDLIRKDCVWFTEKEKDGSTNLYPLVEFKGLNRLSSIQNAYLDGRFGAIIKLNETTQTQER